MPRTCVQCGGSSFEGGARSTLCDECVCGTWPGYQRHRKRGEVACEACKAAANSYVKSGPGYQNARAEGRQRLCSACSAHIGSRTSTICAVCSDERRKMRSKLGGAPPVRACPWCGRRRQTAKGWEGRFSACSQVCAKAVLEWEEAHCTPLASSVYREPCGPQLAEVRPPTRIAQCGTVAGYHRHRYTLGEPACRDCKDAATRYVRLSPRYRARRDGDSIDPLYVAERAGWKCGICGNAIPKDRRHPHPDSLQIDHIVPVSVGGDHRLDNVQASHARCNWSKGARAVGSQLRLVG